MSRTAKHPKTLDFSGAAEIRTRDTIAGMSVFKTNRAKSQSYGKSESDSTGVQCIWKRDAQRINRSDSFQTNDFWGGLWRAPKRARARVFFSLAVVGLIGGGT